MDENNATSRDNGLLAVLTGLAGTFVTGLVLYPLVDIVLERYFVPGEVNKTYRAIINTSFLAWISLACAIGGFANARVSNREPYRNAWLLFGVVAIFLLYMNRGNLDAHPVYHIVMLVLVLAAFLFGTRWGVAMKARKLQRKRNDGFNANKDY